MDWTRTISDGCWWALIAFMFYRAGWRDGRNALVKAYEKTLAEGFGHSADTFAFREAASTTEFERAQWAMAHNIASRLAARFRRAA